MHHTGLRLVPCVHAPHVPRALDAQCCPCPTACALLQLCQDLVRRLREVYGEKLVLRPHVLSAAALQGLEGVCDPQGAGGWAGALVLPGNCAAQHLRVALKKGLLF